MLKNIIRIVLLVSITTLISACGDIGGFINITSQSDSPNEKNIVEVDTDNNPDESPEVKEEEEVEAHVVSPTDIEGVLNLAKKASQSIQSAVMNGTTITQSTTAGVASTEKTVLDSKIYLDPFIQYTFLDTTSDEGHFEDEMYMTEDAMYVYSSEANFWSMIEKPFAEGNPLSVFQESHFDHLLRYQDYFTLSQNDKYFIISYSGPDESYQEVMGESFILMDAFGAAGGMMSESMEDIVLTGTLELFISKDNFYIVEQNYFVKSTINIMSVVMHTTDDNHFKYSSFNTVDSFDVPDEIKNNAKKFPF